MVFLWFPVHAQLSPKGLEVDHNSRSNLGKHILSQDMSRIHPISNENGQEESGCIWLNTLDMSCVVEQMDCGLSFWRILLGWTNGLNSTLGTLNWIWFGWISMLQDAHLTTSHLESSICSLLWGIKASRIQRILASKRWMPIESEPAMS